MSPPRPLTVREGVRAPVCLPIPRNPRDGCHCPALFAALHTLLDLDVIRVDVEETRGDAPLPELLVLCALLHERYVGRHARDLVPLQGGYHLVQRVVTVRAVCYQLGYHGVVEYADVVSFPHACLYPYPWPFRWPEVLKGTGSGEEVAGRVLGVDSSLNRVTGSGNLGLIRDRELLPRRNPKLPLHQIHPRNHFRHWMFHL
mmetsp:Transcript_16571/g.34185  ORF Transcript_16571/g.34185 Transcript_16571/m.34185 type:complete len:201 (+) Transcript_16571:505-1107(+)